MRVLSAQIYESLGESMVSMKYPLEIEDSIRNLWFFMPKDTVGKSYPTFQINPFPRYLSLATISYLEWKDIKTTKEGLNPDDEQYATGDDKGYV